MSKYCDYNSDNFEECLLKDQELRDDFLNRLSPSYKSDSLKKQNKKRLTDNIEYMLGKGVSQFYTDSCSIPFQEVQEISNFYNLYCSYDIDYNRYKFLKIPSKTDLVG